MARVQTNSQAHSWISLRDRNILAESSWAGSKASGEISPECRYHGYRAAGSLIAQSLIGLSSIIHSHSLSSLLRSDLFSERNALPLREPREASCRSPQREAALCEVRFQGGCDPSQIPNGVPEVLRRIAGKTEKILACDPSALFLQSIGNPHTRSMNE